MTIYVKMKDSFFSDWGQSENRTNLYVIECDTQAQANQIVHAAKQRPEMSRIKQVANEPKSNGAILVSLEHWNDLGPIWTGKGTKT